MPRLAFALLTGTEGTEVFCCLRHDIVVQLEGDAALLLVAN